MFLFALSCCQVCKRKHSSSHCLFFRCCPSYKGIIIIIVIWIGINMFKAGIIFFLLLKEIWFCVHNLEQFVLNIKLSMWVLLYENRNCLFWYDDFVLLGFSLGAVSVRFIHYAFCGSRKYPYSLTRKVFGNSLREGGYKARNFWGSKEDPYVKLNFAHWVRNMCHIPGYFLLVSKKWRERSRSSCQILNS